MKEKILKSEKGRLPSKTNPTAVQTPKKYSFPDLLFGNLFCLRVIYSSLTVASPLVYNSSLHTVLSCLAIFCLIPSASTDIFRASDLFQHSCAFHCCWIPAYFFLFTPNDHILLHSNTILLIMWTCQPVYIPLHNYFIFP